MVMNTPDPPPPGSRDWPDRLQDYYRDIFRRMGMRRLFDHYSNPLFYILQDGEAGDEGEGDDGENDSNGNDNDIDEDLVLFWSENDVENNTPDDSDAAPENDNNNNNNDIDVEFVLIWSANDVENNDTPDDTPETAVVNTTVLDRCWFCYPICEFLKLCVVLYSLDKAGTRRLLSKLDHAAALCRSWILDFLKYFPVTIFFAVLFGFWCLFAHFCLPPGGWFASVIVKAMSALFVVTLVVMAIYEGDLLYRDVELRRYAQQCVEHTAREATQQAARRKAQQERERERQVLAEVRDLREHLTRHRHYLARRRCVRLRYWRQPQTREDVPYASAYVAALRREVFQQATIMQHTVNAGTDLPEDVVSAIRPYVYDGAEVDFSFLDPLDRNDDDAENDDDGDRPTVQPDPVDVPEWGPPPEYQFPQHMLQPDTLRSMQSPTYLIQSLRRRLWTGNDYATEDIDPVPEYDDYTQKNAPPAYFRTIQSSRIPVGSLHWRLRSSIEERRTPMPWEHSQRSVWMNLEMIHRALLVEATEADLAAFEQIMFDDFRDGE